MVEYHADPKPKAAEPKKKATISIPIGVVQTLILLMVLADALLIVGLSNWVMEKDLSLRICIGIVIGLVHMFSFIAYREFLRWVWDVK